MFAGYCIIAFAELVNGRLMTSIRKKNEIEEMDEIEPNCSEYAAVKNTKQQT